MTKLMIGLALLLASLGAQSPAAASSAPPVPAAVLAKKKIKIHRPIIRPSLAKKKVKIVRPPKRA